MPGSARTERSEPVPGEVRRTLGGAGGIGVVYRLRRAASASRVLVLLHGMASNMTRWEEFAELTALRDTWDVLRVDLRGHGESLTREAVSLDVWRDDLLAVLDREKYPRAVLLGHCLGGTLAVHAAIGAPSRIAGIVLVDPVLPDALTGPFRALRALALPLRLAIRAVRLLNRLGLHRRRLRPMDLRRMDAEMRALLASGARAELASRYASPWNDLRSLPTAVYLQDLVEILRPLPPLAELAAPVLTLLSTHARFTDPARTRRRLGEVPHGEIVDIDSQHWMLTERPREVRVAIERWCGALPAGPVEAGGR